MFLCLYYIGSGTICQPLSLAFLGEGLFYLEKAVAEGFGAFVTISPTFSRVCSWDGLVTFGASGTVIMPWIAVVTPCFKIEIIKLAFAIGTDLLHFGLLNFEYLYCHCRFG